MFIDNANELNSEEMLKVLEAIYDVTRSDIDPKYPSPFKKYGDFY